LNYAQEERISNLIISPGKIFCTVQGTAPTPYRVNVNFDIIPEKGWDEVLDEIAEKSKFLIQLLDKIMPKEFIEIFERHGYSLFPEASRKLDAKCSCPDKAIPCKHIASTILYIARVVDFNPFILLKLKGMPKEELLERLKELRNKKNPNYQRSVMPSEKKAIKKTTIDKDFAVPYLPAHDLDQNIESFEKGRAYGVGFSIKEPRKTIETLETLGIPSNLEEPDNFELIFRNIFYSVVKRAYKMSSKLKTGKK